MSFAVRETVFRYRIARRRASPAIGVAIQASLSLRASHTTAIDGVTQTVRMHEVHPLPHAILSFGLGWPHWSSPSEGTLILPPCSRSVRDGKEPFVTSTWDSAQNLNLRQDDLRASRRYFITVGTRRLCGQEYCSSCWSSGVDVFSRLFLKSARQRGAREDDVQERGAICCAGTRHCVDFGRGVGSSKGCKSWADWSPSQ